MGQNDPARSDQKKMMDIKKLSFTPAHSLHDWVVRMLGHALHYAFSMVMRLPHCTVVMI